MERGARREERSGAMEITVGLPRALMYYRFGYLWRAFFQGIGCRVAVSGETTRETLKAGSAVAEAECCLSGKLYLGHVAELFGRCDCVLVPRLKAFGPGEELCVRFQGLYDVVRAAFPGAPLIGYNLEGRRGGEARAFIELGRILGAGRAESLRAYRVGALEQEAHDAVARDTQQEALEGAGVKVLLAAQPYLLHDRYVGGRIADILRELGCVPVFSDRCDRGRCREAAGKLSESLYWTLNKEAAGAVELLRGRVDGVLLLAAFPCGGDCLVNELILRGAGGLPIVQLTLDGLEGEAGLRTRLESFADLLRDRRRRHAG